ncbi:hypothetical protein ABQF33_16205 [Mycolicibacterium sp. XJ2]
MSTNGGRHPIANTSPLEHLDDHPATNVGAQLTIREKFGGIAGEAVGKITQVEPGAAVTWEADADFSDVWLHSLSCTRLTEKQKDREHARAELRYLKRSIEEN